MQSSTAVVPRSASCRCANAWLGQLARVCQQPCTGAQCTCLVARLGRRASKNSKNSLRMSDLTTTAPSRQRSRCAESGWSRKTPRRRRQRQEKEEQGREDREEELEKPCGAQEGETRDGTDLGSGGRGDLGLHSHPARRGGLGQGGAEIRSGGRGDLGLHSHRARRGGLRRD